MNEQPASQSCMMLPTYLLLSHPTKNTEVISTTEGLEEAESIATRAQKSSKAWVLLTASQAPSGSLSMSHQRQLACISPKLADGHTQDSAHSTYPWLAPHVPLWTASARSCRELISTFQKAWPTLWDWRKAHKPEKLRALPCEKQTGGSEHPRRLCRIKRSHTILRILSPKGKEVWSGCIHRTGLRKHWNLQLDLLVSQLVKTEGENCFFQMQTQ